MMIEAVLGTVGASILAPAFNNSINTLRPKQDDRRFADDIFKCIFLNKNILISTNLNYAEVYHHGYN